MKFGNLLRTSAEDVPELQNLFVCYKQLKKKLKRLPARRQTPGGGSVDQTMTQEERSFVQTLNADILQFNDLFIEKEEESVIRLADLEEQAASAATSEEIAQVLTLAVDLHGQLLLLVHWSILAYTGLVKILKKHHKRTGFPIRAPHLENLLSQPFCSVELLGQLVRKAEQTSQELAARLRRTGGKPEEAARSSNSPSSPIGDLILAARSSFQEIAKDADDQADQPSSSEDASSDQGQKQTEPVGAGATDDGAVSAPPAKRTRGLPHSHPGPVNAGEQPIGSPDNKRGAPGELERPASKKHQRQDATLEAAGQIQAQATAASAISHAIPNRHDSEGIESNSGQDQTIVQTVPHPTSALPTPADAPASMPPPSLAGRGASVMRQTQAALGLWAQLHDNASTPSTVLQPFSTRWSESAAPSQSTDQSVT